MQSSSSLLDMFPSFTNSSSSTTPDQQGPSSPFFHFPFPFLDDAVDDGLLISHLLSQHHNSTDQRDDHQIKVAATAAAAAVISPTTTTTTTTTTNMISINGASGDGSVPLKAMIPNRRKYGVIKQHQHQQYQQQPLKKTGKTDRHSKICTAQGIRDRRMRLSLKVARKFFDLQDMLGFDKASKTIEWLLIKSEDAIEELACSRIDPQAACNNKHMSSGGDGDGEKNMSSSASESEVVSEIKEIMEVTQIGTEESMMVDKPREKKRRRKSYKVASVNPLARESRDKARARARERTREKMMIRGGHDQNSHTPSTESKPKTGEDSGNFNSQEINSSPQAHLLEEPDQASVGIIEKFLGITRSSSSSSTFSYNSPDFAAAPSEFPGFPVIGDCMEEARMEPAAGCYAMTNIKSSLGNVQVQNNIPNAISRRSSPNAQEHNKLPTPTPPPPPSSINMTISNGGKWNPISVFMASPNVHITRILLLVQFS